MSNVWIQTATGKRFDLLDPEPSMIDFEDIAIALSNLCRYGGHVKGFYSVATHSTWVAHHLGDLGPDCARWGLMHDAAEAYLGNVVSPLKRVLPTYQELEWNLMAVIAERFNLPCLALTDAVKLADQRMYATERRDIAPHMPSWEKWPEPYDVKVVPEGPRVARAVFTDMAMFLKLI